MNLKEAFRFQNKLQRLMEECYGILHDGRNVTKTECTYLRKKVMEGAENETVVEAAPSEYSGKINEIISFTMFLLDERERLFAAIRTAKAALGVDFDAEASLNNKRHDISDLFRRMADIRSSEAITQNGGFGYRFNTDGNQVTYKCDLKRVTTINFDRNAVRKYAAELSRHADEVSAQLDRALVNSVVDYEAPFDVNDSFADVLDAFISRAEQ